MRKNQYVKTMLTVFILSIIVAGSIPNTMIHQYDAIANTEETESRKTIIEGIRQYSISAETSDFVDTSYTPTIGFNTNEPPNGMGENNSGAPAYRTVLTESEGTGQEWQTKQNVPTFSGLPTIDWSDSEMDYSGGYFHQRPYSGYQYGGFIIGDYVDTSGSNEVRFSLDIGGDWNPQAVSVSFWDGSAWDYIGSYDDHGGDEIIRTQSFSSTSLDYQIPNFRVQVYYGLFDEGEQTFQANGWFIEAEYDYTYQAFQAVYSFDTVDYDNYAIEELHVDFSEGFTSTENIAFRFAADNPAPTTVIVPSTSGDTDFTIDVHSYVTGSTCYVDIRDISRSKADVVANSWYIDRMYLLLVDPKPVWDDIPTDQILEYADSFSYQMNATFSPALDTWVVNDTTNFVIDGSGLITNATISPVGQYGLLISANDTYGRTISDEILITVEDTTKPVWTTPITDQQEEYGHEFEYIIGAYDLTGIKTWFLNDQTNFTINFGVISNNTVLDIGNYWLNVTVLDNNDNSRSSDFKLFVNDTAFPEWNPDPEDQFHEFGNDFRYDLNATDLAGTHIWQLNDTDYFNIDSDGIVTNITVVPVNTYPLEVMVNDTHGNQISGVFSIFVIDSLVPVWDEVPEDQIIEFGSSFLYILNADDAAGIGSWWMNNSANFQINSGEIVNITSLAVGNYSLHIIVTDIHGLSTDGYFTVRVVDTTPPTWNEYPAVQILESGAQLALQLDVTDLAGIAQWIVNDTETFTITNNGLLTSIGNLNSGTYYVEVTVVDDHGQSSSYVIEIFVALPPTSTTTTDPNQALFMMLTIGGIAIGAVVLFASLRTWRAVQKDRLKQIEDGKGEVDTALDYLESIKSDDED